MRKNFYLFLLILLSGCGYKISSSQPSIAISHVEKDYDGMLAATLAKQLTDKGITYNNNSNLKLIVKIIERTTNDIGYMHDKEENGQPKQNILACEGREKIVTEISLKNEKEGKIIIGPLKISAYSDFDFIQQDAKQELVFTDIHNQQQETLPFSLGQLEAKESAEHAAQRPLYQKLAKNIIDVITSYL